MKNQTLLIIALLSAGMLITSCNLDEFYKEKIGHCVLGPEVSVMITDHHNSAITGADISVINTRVGRELCVDENGNTDQFCLETLGETEFTSEGEYIIVSTSSIGLNNSGSRHVQHRDILKVTAEKEGASVTANYIIELIGDGFCYPKELLGPNLLVLELPGN